MKRSIPVLALSILCAAWWMRAVDAEPDLRIDPNRWLGTPLQVENLTVWPVITDAPMLTGEFLSLHEAIEKGLAQVREKGAANDGTGQNQHRQQRDGDAATVDELVIENRGDRPILVTAGTIVKGGKQDRQLGQDLVVDARSTVPIDAFCVEQGRWNERREGRSTGGVFEVPKVKAAKRVRAAGQYEKNQSEVWTQVDKVNSAAQQEPATSTFLATAEDGNEKAQEVRRRFATTVKRHFAGLDGPGEVVGFAYSVNGEPIGLRAFANRALLEAHFEPFVETMSLEAQVIQFRDRRAGREPFDRAASSEALLALVRGINEARVKIHVTSGSRLNNTRSNEWGGRSTYLVPTEDGLVPLTEDWTAASELRGRAREILRRLQALGYSKD